MVLLSKAPEQRDLGLSAIARDHALDGITTRTPSSLNSTVPAVANQLRALLTNPGEGQSIFSDAEQSLLSEWLQRLVSSSV